MKKIMIRLAMFAVISLSTTVTNAQTEQPPVELITLTSAEKMTKETLKKDFYKEDAQRLYESLPDSLVAPSKFVKTICHNTMTEAQLIKNRVFFSKVEASGLAIRMKETKEQGLIWFTNDNGKICYILVRYYDYQNCSSFYLRRSIPEGNIPQDVVSYFKS